MLCQLDFCTEQIWKVIDFTCELLTVAMCVLARAEASSTGQALLQKKYMVIVRGCGQQDGSFGEGKDTLYRLLEDDPHSALNAGQTAACSPIQGRSGLYRALGPSHVAFQVHADWCPSVLSSACRFLCCWLGFAWVWILG